MGQQRDGPSARGKAGDGSALVVEAELSAASVGVSKKLRKKDPRRLAPWKPAMRSFAHYIGRGGSDATHGGTAMRLILTLAVAGIVAACTSDPSTQRVFSEGRALVSGDPKAIGEDCSSSGSDGCLTQLCLKIEPGIPGRHICTVRCRPDGLETCPAAWECIQIRPGSEGFVCIPPPAWASRAVTPEPVSIRVQPVLPPRTTRTSAFADGGRP